MIIFKNIFGSKWDFRGWWGEWRVEKMVDFSDFPAGSLFSLPDLQIKS